MEEEIARTKRELGELFRQETLASRRGDAAEAGERHLALLGKELDNIRAIARYVEPISAPVARDLTRWHAQMTIRFEELRRGKDAAALQRWVAQDLVPHLRRSEQLAHLVATNARIRPEKPSTPFVWPVAARRAAQGARTPPSR